MRRFSPVLGLLVGALLSASSSPASAWNWRDLWLRKDQQAAQALQNGNFSQAAKMADDPLQKGVAAYRQGDYSRAAQDFSQGRGSLADFNRGNALAKMGRLEEAIDAYKAALDEQPDLEDARANRDLVEQLLRQQQQQQQQQQSSDGQGQKQPQSSSSGDQGRSQTQDAQSGDQPQSLDQARQDSQSANADKEATQGKSKESESESADNEQKNGADGKPSSTQSRKEANMASQAKKPGEQSPDDAQQPARVGTETDTPPSEEQQAMRQWLERIPDDPGGLLRRKFLYQYQRRGRSPTADPNQPAW